MAEEYSVDTDVLLRRAWRRRTTLGGDGQWEVEIGDPEPRFTNLDQVGIKESNTTVISCDKSLLLLNKIT